MICGSALPLITGWLGRSSVSLGLITGDLFLWALCCSIHFGFCFLMQCFVTSSSKLCQNHLRHFSQLPAQSHILCQSHRREVVCSPLACLIVNKDFRPKTRTLLHSEWRIRDQAWDMSHLSLRFPLCLQYHLTLLTHTVKSIWICYETSHLYCLMIHPNMHQLMYHCFSTDIIFPLFRSYNRPRSLVSQCIRNMLPTNK